MPEIMLIVYVPYYILYVLVNTGLAWMFLLCNPSFCVNSIPHFGHLPGLSDLTSGCIEQVYVFIVFFFLVLFLEYLYSLFVCVLFPYF